ncbi:Aste57867_21975 [Aphanomyces stellatus]|uniref:Aste57867_21975 protein n=1 Tax=Aphanomyces stellatus TaxID=120398 RepID=A0A485LJM8_9STRA|nr:hypothetical protein As57867_021906 [Aphanomyces stellatus]VFT98643.1 Aste57867_21975 [Aphanomyces stellatus]
MITIVARSSRSLARHSRVAAAAVYHTQVLVPSGKTACMPLDMAIAGTTALCVGSLLGMPDAHTHAHVPFPQFQSTSSKTTDSASSWDLSDQVLGAGAFGVVHLGIRRDTGEVGAVKMQRNLKHRDSIQRELHALQVVQAKGGHKNIIALKDVFERDGHTCIVTEFVSGGELFDHIVNHGAFSEQDARKPMRDIVEAVAFLHAHGLIHKDLKPENVLLRFKDRARADNAATLVDFGSAGPASRASSADEIGTTVYQAPELLRRDSECTQAADVWSLGCILYVLLTGRHPFDLDGTATERQIEARIRRGKVSFKHPACRDLSPDAKDLISQLLTKDPIKRPSAQAVLDHPWMRATKAKEQPTDLLTLAMLAQRQPTPVVSVSA